MSSSLSKENKSIGRRLSRILRHSAVQTGLDCDTSGWVSIHQLIERSLPEGTTRQDLYEIVEHDQKYSKGRFSISEDSIFIRANQGHSMDHIKPETFMTKITEPIHCVHGTSYERLGGSTDVLLKKIDDEKVGEETVGLSRMGRNHVHFATGLDAKSGMRSTSDLYVWCNMAAAMAEGYIFYMSANGVILCSGNKNGIIPAKFLTVLHKQIRDENGDPY